MKKILLFGAGKSATCLIDYLIVNAVSENWLVTIADANPQSLQSKIGSSQNIQAVALNVENEAERRKLVQQADIVISLLPPAFHITIARECIELEKNLLTASYIDDPIKDLQGLIKSKGLFFLYEMGLDPGIDHMSAMKIIDDIKKKNGKISSFKSHTGGLVAPESDDNPWHYKISWNPRNIVRAGAAGAIFKENNQIKNLSYEKLFENTGEVNVSNAGKFSYYPNRDSLSYIPVYGLEAANTFIRTTLRHPDFCKNWKWIVLAGLTDDKKIIETKGLNYKNWSQPIEPFINEENKNLFSFLGFFDSIAVQSSAKTSADILQYLLETKWVMHPHDKDMIVMLHELEYTNGNQHTVLNSALVVKGENSSRTAMAKTVGLPLGIAAKLILQNKIKLTGLHIPIVPEIYEPVLLELSKNNIEFHETSSQLA
ncbi:MAG: saccharopine dehydrogenase NADP-binding domain-containing protein [Bacteroidetes bacterium]|nr:saccharopine dehydrogenase NADP-binding domain-containing protein [Bacteroidota bacterium]